jgi:hypothetical protein
MELDAQELLVRDAGMPEEELSLEILCDLIQRELQNALEDLAVIREKKSRAKRRFPIVSMRD